MIFLLLSFWLKSAVAAQSNIAPDIKELKSCVETFNESVGHYQTGLSHLTWKVDPQILGDLDILQGLKLTLSWTEKRNSGGGIETGVPHLIGNAYESCISTQKDFYQRAKINFWVCCSLPPLFFILSLGLGLILSGAVRRVGKKRPDEMMSGLRGFTILFFMTFWSGVLKAENLTIYTYDGLTGKGSFGEILKKEFKKRTGSDLNLISFSTSGEALNQVVVEGKSTKADLLLGVDSGFAPRAESTGLFIPIGKKHFSKIEPHVIFGTSNIFLPFDYGFLAFLYDKNRTVLDAPHWKSMTFGKFLGSEEIRKKIVIEDPRTSSIGFSFLRWTREYFKNLTELDVMWKNFFPKLTTVTPGWSGAYGMFLKGETEWVLSYTTSRAYHLEKEKKDQYQVLFFEDGHAIQAEGVAVVKYSKKTQLIDAFLEMLMEEETQKSIPTTQWMYPAIKGIKLPDSFQIIPKPKPFQLSNQLSEEDRKNLIEQWVQWGIKVP